MNKRRLLPVLGLFILTVSLIGGVYTVQIPVKYDSSASMQRSGSSFHELPACKDVLWECSIPLGLEQRLKNDSRVDGYKIRVGPALRTESHGNNKIIIKAGNGVVFTCQLIIEYINGGEEVCLEMSGKQLCEPLNQTPIPDPQLQSQQNWGNSFSITTCSTDPDYNDDGSITSSDLSYFVQNYVKKTNIEELDLNCDSTLDSKDWKIMQDVYFDAK